MRLFVKIDHGIEAVASVFDPSLRKPAKIALYLTLLAILVWIPYSIVHHVRTSGFYLISVEREEEVGRETAEKIRNDLAIMEQTEPIALYVNEVGRSISRRNNPWQADFRFRVIDDPRMINAFAIPGGKIYVTTGLLESLDNEAELAAVLAHEVAHVTRRHYARNLGRQMLMSWLKKFLGSTDQAMLETGSFLTANITFLRMRQEDELEADYQGALYIYDLNYDTAGEVSLITKLLQLEKQTPDHMKFLSLTHPPSRERLNAVVELEQTLPQKEGLTLGQERYKEEIRQMDAGSPAPSSFSLPHEARGTTYP